MLRHEGSFEKGNYLIFFSKLAENDVPEDKNVDNNISDSDILGTEGIQEKSDKNVEKSEVKKVINIMKNRKAAGTDKIILELLKSFDENMQDLTTLILNFIFQKGSLPEE